jgi:GT2 family glycosyltransferase
MTQTLVSVIILNFNGAKWLPRCLKSLGEQTIVSQLEIIVADNGSTDGSDKLASAILSALAINSQVVQNGGNLGYCEGNNRGAKSAQGKYLLFLNADTWLEPDCLEKLVGKVESANANGASPMVLNYNDNSFQCNGASGFDVFGYLTGPRAPLGDEPILAAPGCALLVEKSIFEQVGGFDPELYMYADEADLAWRLTLCGATTISVPAARVHHRGAVAANPKGGERVVEYRTNEMVRFLATRNSFLILLKNAEHLLLFLFVTQLFWILAEMLAVLAITRRFGTVRRTYLRAFGELWRLRHHVLAERQRIKSLRKHGDFWMTRFLRLRLGRLADLEKLVRYGPPHVGR